VSGGVAAVGDGVAWGSRRTRRSASAKVRWDARDPPDALPASGGGLSPRNAAQHRGAHVDGFP